MALLFVISPPYINLDFWHDTNMVFTCLVFMPELPPFVYISRIVDICSSNHYRQPVYETDIEFIPLFSIHYTFV